MSEGADSVTQTCGNSLTTLGDEGDAATATAAPTPPPPSSSTYTGRRPRFGTGGIPPSPYVWIDGRQLRSALAWTKKSSPRRVSFPMNDSLLVTGYLEPANPWRHAENVSREDLIFAYKESCARHSTDPLQNVLTQLENLDISQDRCTELDLKGEILDQDRSEPLEEILKRIQFNKINLEGTSLNEESSIILFDMLEYYESVKCLNISCNPEIGARGWQACSHMIKKTQCLEQLEARDIMLNEQYMNILSRALRLVCHLHVLKLENCGLSGRAIVILVTALKMNNGIRELYLADNGLDLYDAIQLGSLLRMNNHLQLLDISNNNVQDDGVRDILEGLINQVNEDKTGKGLSILILWNNRLTNKSSPYFSRIIALSKTLETLNIGQNMLTNESLSTVNESLKNNRVLLQLGMRSTELTCDGVITLAEIMEVNQVLQRIDLRDNSIQMAGMRALVSVLKKNKSITQIDLDDKPRIRIDGPLHQYVELVAEIRKCCNENEKRLLEESTEDIESPQHSNRLLNASSRKISLTCQTLPSPSRPAASLVADESARIMLEPKRTSGGRLRSPAPSPIPSPVASPIPSPSRNRFVVSRVPEASLRSADSSASSSPVTPPSLGSSPTCCFPGVSGPSRFRVSVVESVGSGHPSPKPVVASSNCNVTIGFNFRVDAIESTDSNDPNYATKTDVVTQSVSANAAAPDINTLNIVSVAKEMSHEDIAGSSEDYRDKGTESEEIQLDDHEMGNESIKYENTKNEDGCNKTMEIKEIQLSQDDVETQSKENEDVATVSENYRDKNNATPFKSDAKIVEDSNHCNMYTSTKELQVPAYSNEDIENPAMRVNVFENKTSNCPTKMSSSTSESTSIDILGSSINTTLKPSSTHGMDSYSQERINMSVQRHKSNLEKLLSLFQHPGQFFSESSYNGSDARSSLQENVSGSMMALGDKLQQYLKESRAKVSMDSAWSSEHVSALKNRSVKINVSQLQNLTDVFTTNLKLEPSIEYSANSSNQTQDTPNSEHDSERSTEIQITKDDEKDIFQEKKENNLIDEEISQVPKNEDESLFDQEKNWITRKDDNKYLLDKKNQIIKNEENNLFDQEKNRIREKDESDLIDEEKNQVQSIDEVILFNPEKNWVTRNEEKDLLDQGKNKLLVDNENNLFDQKDPKREENEQDVVDNTKTQETLNDEKNLFNLEGILNVRIDEKHLEEQLRNQTAEDDGQSLKDQEKRINDQDLKDQEENLIMKNEDKDFIQDNHINIKKDTDNVNKLQSIESDRNELPLPESVQSKDDFFDKDLVLDSDDVATSAAMSPSLANKSMCVAIELTDIPEYSVLELSQIDGLGCNDAKLLECSLAKHSERFERCDDHDRQGCNNAENLQHLEHDDAKPLEYNDSERLVCDEAKCVKCGNTVEEAMMKRTCDIITTDSINQTSDNSFPICNIDRDRRDIDSISIASVPMSAVINDIDIIMSTSDNGSILSSISMDDIGASSMSNDHLSDEVTNNKRCIADKDYSDDFMTRDSPPEVFDDACRETTHRRSTSIDIKIEGQVLETTSSTSTSQDSPEKFRERQSSMPNNVDVHRTILKDVAETDSMEDDVDDDKRIDPAILVTPYEISAILDKSDAEEFIFCMTDISTDGTSVDDELSPGITSRSSSNDVGKETDSYFELPATTLTATLLIENPEDIHRNSQDSGIEETALTIDDGITVDAHPLPPPRGSLQESVDSGIESECSSICVKTESVAERNLETIMPLKRFSHNDNNTRERDDSNAADDGDDDLGEFTSDFLIKEGLVDSDNVSGIAHSFVGSIMCTVVSPARPIASNTSLEVVVPDEDVARTAAAVIAHSPAAVHDTSPK